VDAEGICWIWTGAVSSSGYGVIGRGRKGEGFAFTHRAAWELLVGAIPPDLILDHLCRVKTCCNPDHLEPVTRAENARRGARGPGWAARQITHCVHGHEFTAANTMICRTQRRCRTCDRARDRKRVAA
jgi:hypothetical protein